MTRIVLPMVLVLAMMVMPAVPAAATLASDVSLAPNLAFLHTGPAHNVVTSTNWAGYAVTGSTGSVSFVKGSWIQPGLTGCSGRTAYYSSFWVGIDGYNSPTVEQTGTEADCQAGTIVYTAWYEFYPAYPVTISTIKVHPGDTFSASVKYVGHGSFQVTLDDVTTGHSYSHTKAVTGAHRTSAEWIAEAPYSGGVLPLADFGKAKFGHDATSVTATNEATISGATHVIGGFSSGSIHRINMILSSTITKAATGALTPDGSSFNITWKHH